MLRWSKKSHTPEFKRVLNVLKKQPSTEYEIYSYYGGWFAPCRIISVFRAKTRKVATRKPAKWWFWRVFAWRPFAPPGKDTINSIRKRNVWNIAYFRLAGRKVAMRKHEQVTIWRVFAWHIFAPKTRLYDMAQISHHTFIIMDLL